MWLVVFHTGEWKQSFKTMNGIPIKFFRVDDFEEQANERPIHTNSKVATPGYSTSNGTRMQCTAHFAGLPDNSVFSEGGTNIGASDF